MSEQFALSMPTPMLNVVDVAETIQWYELIGFKTELTNKEWDPDCELNWALIGFGQAELMINAGGTDQEDKKQIQLFFTTNQVDQLYEQLKDKVKVIYEPVDQFYGQRDFEIQDLNGYHLVFGQPS
jgi:uncharacterized glyoxalase superfamily protein PhnB